MIPNRKITDPDKFRKRLNTGKAEVKSKSLRFFLNHEKCDAKTYSKTITIIP